MPTVREAIDADLDVLVRLNGEVHALHVEHAPRRYRAADEASVRQFFTEFLARPGVQAAVAHEDGVPLGYVVTDLQPATPGPLGRASPRLYVDQIGVTADARGRGVGRMLMAWAEARARSEGCDHVLLDVAGFNDAARAFYERLGYGRWSTRLSKAIDDPTGSDM